MLQGRDFSLKGLPADPSILRDIDVSLDRAALGFTGKRDLANEDLSNTKRKQLDKQLREAIENEGTTKILPRLTESFASVIGKTGWSLQASAEAGEEMTLLFCYVEAIPPGEGGL